MKLIASDDDAPEAWKRRADRLIERAVDYLGVSDQLPQVRSHYCVSPPAL
jgi:hypothetical protein